MLINTETKALHEQRASLVTEMEKIRKTAKDESRNMSAEESKKFDDLDTKQESLYSEIKRIEKLAELTASEKDRILEEAKKEKDNSPELLEVKQKKQRVVFTKFLRFGERSLEKEERAIIQDLKTRAQSVGVTTEGGFLVPEGFQAELVSALKTFGGVREVARILVTSTGNDIPWPKMDDTSNIGELLGENTTVNEQDLVFGSTTLKAYKYSSRAAKVSNELLQDSAINVDSILTEALAIRIGRITNIHFTTGDNSGKPNGIVTTSGLGVTAASNTAITYGEIVDLEHSVDPAYRKNGKFMFHDNTLKAIKKLSIGSSDARPLWDPAILKMGMPATVLGYSYVINQDMASSLVAAAKVALFGDFSFYIVRDVMPFTLKRLVERYADADQVGFFAFSRHDGRKISSDNPYKHLLMGNT